MNTRVRTFFGLYREANRLQAKEYREALRIARTPAMIDKYYIALDTYYTGIIDPEFNPSDLPPKVSRPAMDLASVDSRNAIISLFSKARQRGKLTPYGR